MRKREGFMRPSMVEDRDASHRRPPHPRLKAIFNTPRTLSIVALTITLFYIFHCET